MTYLDLADIKKPDVADLKKIDYHDLDILFDQMVKKGMVIPDHLGTKSNIEAALGDLLDDLSNDGFMKYPSHYDVTVKEIEKNIQYILKEVQKISGRRNDSEFFNCYLNFFCYCGLIPEGTYVIWVSW